MKEVTYYQQAEMIAWAEERLPAVKFRDDAKAIGLKSWQGYHAVVVFDTFSPSNCIVAVASDGTKRWLNKEFIVRCMAYPFIQLEYPRITAYVSTMNLDSLNFSRRFGWKEEGRIREGGIFGEDLIIFGMLRRECHWLETVASSQNMRSPV